MACLSPGAQIPSEGREQGRGRVQGHDLRGCREQETADRLCKRGRAWWRVQGQEGPSPENPGCTQGGPGRSGGVQQVPSPACYAAQGLSAAHIVEAWSWERT
eukprot:1152901-Pelagomonas_calceolata.AAC.12